MVETRTHPDFPEYQLTAQKAIPFTQAVSNWRTSLLPIEVPRYGITWTPERARRFYEDLSGLMHVYNQVVWEEYNFCRVCKGRCCVRGAPSVEGIDFLALALLDQPYPILSGQDDSDARLCVYLQGHFCSWPDAWRTFGCWTFYCLGPPVVYESIANGRDTAVMYAQLASSLENVVNDHLPEELRLYEQAHGIRLASGVGGASGFAWEMIKAVDRILVEPFLTCFNLLDISR